MENLPKNPKEVTDAIQRVLSGDVNSYKVIYDVIDKPLRANIDKMYGHLDHDFRNEVANRTHTFVFENLHRYNPGYASIQTWSNWCSRNVALRVMTERFTLHKVKTESGRWERESISIAMDEEALTLASKSGPDSSETLWLKHVLWQEYDALAREGRLSLALHVVEGRPLHETAKMLNMPVITLRRLLDRELRRLRKKLRRRGVGPDLPRPHHGMVNHAGNTAYDDDWTTTQTPVLPDEPDTGTGAAENEEEE